MPPSVGPGAQVYTDVHINPRVLRNPGLAGRPVRFRFHLRHGKLYSFWVSPDESGASRGYVAAGGPGFPGAVDTVGIQANHEAERLRE